MIVLDASVLIAYLAEGDPNHLAARSILSRIDDFGVHTITIAEALIRGEVDGRLDDVATKIASLGVRELDRVSAEPKRLARIRVATRLKMPDCCVLMAAESVDAQIATFDRRLAQAAAARHLRVLDGGDRDGGTGR